MALPFRGVSAKIYSWDVVTILRSTKMISVGSTCS